jgi:hypothetical protein
MNEDAILEYMTHLDRLPPSKTILDSDGRIWLYGGWHRYAAHERAKRKTIRCHVTQGTLEDAIEAAAGENTEHGVRRTNEDKRRAVELLLGLSAWSDKSDRMIADRLGVSHAFVGTVRNSKDTAPRPAAAPPEPSANGTPAPAARVGKDGKTRATPSASTTTKDQKVFDCSVPPVEIPDRLRDVFQDPWLKRIMALADDAMLKLEPDPIIRQLKGKSQQYAAWLRTADALTHLSAAEDAINAFRHTLEAGVPFAVCPTCKGKKCDDCRRTGWIPIARYEELKDGG